MRVKGTLVHEARIAFGLAALLPALLLPGYALFGWLVWRTPSRPPALGEIAAIFERLLPLSAGLIAGHLLSIEREEGFDSLRRSYPERSWRLPLLRSLGAVVLTLGAAAFASLILRQIYGDAYTIDAVVLPALPPSLYLLGLALLVNNVSGSYWVAAAVVAGYFFLEYFTMGEYTGVLFLFQATAPNPSVDYDVNRLLLTVFGVVFLLGTIIYSDWRRKRGE